MQAQGSCDTWMDSGTRALGSPAPMRTRAGVSSHAQGSDGEGRGAPRESASPNPRGRYSAFQGVHTPPGHGQSEIPEAFVQCSCMFVVEGLRE